MEVGVIDADLIGRKRHRFPNLAIMKISGFYKSKENNVKLLMDYNDIQKYNKVYISKVFTDTDIPTWVLNMPNTEYGGTGFFFDKAPPLPNEIEHHMPDYNLYNDWINEQLSKGKKRKEFEEYLDYSLGFMTRGCVRQCDFCVNKKYKKVNCHSPLSEFYDRSRKYICLLDDNIFAFPHWKNVFLELMETGKFFKFKQGLDERLLTREKCDLLSKSKYKGDFTFAFDYIKDKNIVVKKLKMWHEYSNKNTKFYVLCGFDRDGKYDELFWKQDIIDTLERIKILMEYQALPYIMRFEKYKESPYVGMYIELARWVNQPSIFKKKSFREFSFIKGQNLITLKRFRWFEEKYPDISKKYFDLKYEDHKKEGFKCTHMN